MLNQSWNFEGVRSFGGMRDVWVPLENIRAVVDGEETDHVRGLLRVGEGEFAAGIGALRDVFAGSGRTRQVGVGAFLCIDADLLRSAGPGGAPDDDAEVQ